MQRPVQGDRGSLHSGSEARIEFYRIRQGISKKTDGNKQEKIPGY